MICELEYKKGDLLDVNYGIIAHGVNCQGVMGSGVAKSIRSRYPKVYGKYLNFVQDNNRTSKSSNLLGSVQAVEVHDDLVVLNMFTQDFYGAQGYRFANYEAIARCFETTNKLIKGLDCEFKTLNIPKIGAGLANGDWNVIEAIVKSEYKGRVIVWELM